IPLAAGAFIALTGWKLNPMFAAAAMSLSSFCVVSNALRLNLFDLRSTKRDRRVKHEAALPNLSAQPEPEAASAAAVIHIKGMMCAHCEARVKEALEAIPAVQEAVPDHKTGTAAVTLTAPLDKKAVKTAVKDAGYKVTGFTE
ncbi:MAG: metal-transporting ATPase, partial [Oscillospiraceae bacterium]|nr:metal-transporting ATPase [Oscillospiraceae bacterium]